MELPPDQPQDNPLQPRWHIAWTEGSQALVALQFYTNTLEVQALGRHRDCLALTRGGYRHGAGKAAAVNGEVDLRRRRLPHHGAGRIEGALLPISRDAAAIGDQLGAQLDLV